MRIHEITVDLQALTALHEARVIRRIDGNHRLHRAADLAQDRRIRSQYLAPFCAILLGPPDDANDDFEEAMLFHVINSTARHLDSEHALRLVLGQGADFFPAEEEFRTSPALHLTRLLKQGLDGLPRLQRNRLGDMPLSVLHDAAQALVMATPELSEDRANQATFADSFNGALTAILGGLGADHPHLRKADFFVELAALVWRETITRGSDEERVVESVRMLDGLGRWLGANGLEEIEKKSSMAEQLLRVYKSVLDRVPKRVFLARWYPTARDGDEQGKAKLRLDMVDRTLKDLAEEESPINLKLVDMGTQIGGTFPIHQDMYREIRQADIVLVDLSGVRPNVCVEAGHALERHKKDRLLFMFQPTGKTETNPEKTDLPFDLDTFKYERLSDAAEIPDKLKPHLREIWQRAQLGS